MYQELTSQSATGFANQHFGLQRFAANDNQWQGTLHLTAERNNSR
jgi:hypothetical protein